MKRTQIQLPEQTFDTLREQAFREHTSISDIIRRVLERTVGERREQKEASRQYIFSFIGKGRSRGKHAGRISEYHDKEFVDTLQHDFH